MDPSVRAYVGIDWSVDTNQVCIVDPEGQIVDETVFVHDPGGLDRLAGRLLDAGKGIAQSVLVAIEVPHGPVVELLMERGFGVYSLNPKQLDRFRDRFSVAGAKDDRLDALVLADSLRTDRRHFRRVEPDDPVVIELRELSRIHDDLQQDKTRMVNRLREQLRRYYPQFLTVAPALDRAWVLALLEHVPTPEQAKRVRLASVRRVLSKNGARSNPEVVLDGLRQPGFEVAEGTAKAASIHILMLIERLRVVLTQTATCKKQIERLTDQFASVHSQPTDGAGPEDSQGQEREQHDVEILRSLPGVGRITLGVLLAEAWRPLEHRDYHAIRALSGVAPVTRRTGKRKKPIVLQRRACNGRLRNAMYHCARVAAQRDPVWKVRYHALRSRGHSHGRALRTLGDRLLKVACVMLEHQQSYDSSLLQRAA